MDNDGSGSQNDAPIVVTEGGQQPLKKSKKTKKMFRRSREIKDLMDSFVFDDLLMGSGGENDVIQQELAQGGKVIKDSDLDKIIGNHSEPHRREKGPQQQAKKRSRLDHHHEDGACRPLQDVTNRATKPFSSQLSREEEKHQQTFTQERVPKAKKASKVQQKETITTVGGKKKQHQEQETAAVKISTKYKKPVKEAENETSKSSSLSSSSSAAASSSIPKKGPPPLSSSFLFLENLTPCEQLLKPGTKECKHKRSNDIGYLYHGGFAMTCKNCNRMIRICLCCNTWVDYK